MTIDTEYPADIVSRYQFEAELGHGAYGTVYSGTHTLSNLKVAIKKITKVFDKQLYSKRTLRELKILKHFNSHENITSLLDLSADDGLNELYLVQDLMEADLHQIIKSNQKITDGHFQFFLYQICRGLKYIHSANVMHRDLKPGNILVNADCTLKICDFGMARGIYEVDTETPAYMTEYVATRWYRAPEIMLVLKSYTKAVDIWALGCIFGELLGRKPMFIGKDYVDQLNLIINVCGTPKQEVLEKMCSERALKYINGLKKKQKIDFKSMFPLATQKSIDLLELLVEFDPGKRPSIDEILKHPYLENYHDDDDEPSHIKPLDFSFELLEEKEDIRDAILSEVIEYKSLRKTLLIEKNDEKIVPAEPPSQDISSPENSNNSKLEESFSEDIEDYIASISPQDYSSEPLTPPRSFDIPLKKSKPDGSWINVNIEKHQLLIDSRGEKLMGSGFACVTMVFGLVANRVWKRPKI